MSDTSSTADAGGFDPGRLRTAPTQMLRSRDDRYIAGVGGGLARYLNIDPVIVRVLLAALTVVGGVGLVVYIAAWLLAPEEGAEQSVLESHLPGNPKVRTIGWIVTGVIVVAAVVGSGPWFDWGWVGPFPLLALAILGWLLFRPHKTATPPPEANVATGAPETADPPGPPDAADAAAAAADAAPSEPPEAPEVDVGDTPTARAATDSPPGDATTVRTAIRPHDAPPAESPTPGHDPGVLTWMTLAAVAVVVGGLWLIDQSGTEIDGPVYLAGSLGVVAAGILAGTWWGNGRWLIPVGVALTAALITVSQLPVWKFGQIDETPTRAVDVRSTYEMGAGQIDLDLTRVEDLAALDGRTVTLENGMGQIRVQVPEDLDVTVVAEVNAGNVEILGREANGADAATQYTDPDDADPDLRLELDGSLGHLEVTRP